MKTSVQLFTLLLDLLRFAWQSGNIVLHAGHVRSVLVFVSITTAPQLKAQDPNFSQFWASPLNVNPALTANINGDWRSIMNFRNQWIGPTAPYMTGTISFDSKLLQGRLSEGQRFGAGGMLMYDKTMSGVLKSTYGSANVSYNILVAEGLGSHYVGAGVGLIYGHKRMDWSRATFGEQYNGRGFDVNMPSGESALSNMKPYLSGSVGLTYSYQNDIANFDFGMSAFHVNRPRQTFLKDERERLATRYVAHANYERNLSESVVLTTNGIYQRQTTASYFSIGGGLGYILDEEFNTSLSAGVWYWSKNAVVPYVGATYKNLQLGFSYDVLISKLKDSPGIRSTWEVSLIFRDLKELTGVIYCPPWK